MKQYAQFSSLLAGLLAVAPTILDPLCGFRRVDAPAFPEMPRTAIPHVTDAAIDRIPEYQKVATVEIVRSGKWSEIMSGPPLAAADVVRINPGVTVTYDVQSDTAFKALVLQEGSLVFAPEVDTRLRVGTILVLGGKFVMKPAAGVVAEVVFDGRLDRAADPFQFSVGLVAPSGQVEIQGVAPRTGYARLSRRIEPGSTAFQVDRDVDWKAGDSLVLAGVTFKETGNAAALGILPGNEFPTIAAINGRTVTVTQPLTVLHEEGVANLTRNARFTSAPNSDRGHVIFLHEAVANVRGASFDRLGRTENEVLDDTTWDAAAGRAKHVGTNQRGRYPLHAHHVHHPVVIEDNVIFGYPELRWSISIHASHGLVSRNILVNPGGAGLVAENGFETGVWRDNVAFGNQGGVYHGPRDPYETEGGLMADGKKNREDLGFEGTGFWLRSKTVDLLGNTAEGSFRQAGFKMYFFQPAQQIHEISQLVYPEYRGVTTPYQGQRHRDVASQIDSGRLPRGQFKDNSSYCYGLNSQSGCFALASKWGGGSTANPFVADNFTVRHGGYSLMYSSPQKIINSSMDGSGAHSNYVCGYNLVTDNTHAVTIENCSISNYRKGFEGNCRSLILRNVELNNRDGEIFVTPAYRSFVIVLDNVKFSRPDRRIVMKAIGGLRQPEFLGHVKAPTPNAALWDAISESPQGRVVVRNYDRVPGDDFEVLFQEQNPATTLANLGGVSNEQIRNGLGVTPTSSGVYGRMINGFIPEVLQTRPGIVGYVTPIRTTLPFYDLGGPVVRVRNNATKATLKYLINPTLHDEPVPDPARSPGYVTGGTLHTENVNVVPGLNKITRDLPGVGKYTFLVLKD